MAITVMILILTCMHLQGIKQKETAFHDSLFCIY